LESLERQRAHWSWKRILIIGMIVTASLVFLIPFALVTLILGAMHPSIENQQQQSGKSGLNPELIAIYQEVGNQHHIPWTLLPALHQLNRPAAPTGMAASGRFEGEIQAEAAALSYGSEATTTINTNMKNTGGRFPWPCEGRITSGFGMRWGHMHKGVDIANSSGTPIYSVADGVVTVAKQDPGGFGFYLVIDHGRGISTLYGHMYPSTVKVQVGQQVKKGQLIAEIGSNGNATDPHLHFEVHVNNNPVDPMSFLLKR
jgi:murein DD-endopeptidase MepM/ murein hydrolase activator NlpD